MFILQVVFPIYVQKPDQSGAIVHGSQTNCPFFRALVVLGYNDTTQLAEKSKRDTPKDITKGTDFESVPFLIPPRD